ncbi:alpha-1,2-fucosyltransferase [Christiangramia forsetii]|uniref:Alpha-1,2-fucosyltransferase n=2 Tax=Christiangramia forsetii TaxID=411153 RepID=A0LYU7_CHRFK|nr:alpha-1,2-fucosyltransferase [Christiangramia forsetii]GGG33320.1 alpha-1,2-fucosyltransferase [Christiangramia forsetii]CAL65542.1 alpha-1,2-fucosyltransferase [Christiangramia forsetii KT0803]
MSNKNPVIVEIMGGLGNQMFQFAVAKLLAEKNSSVLLVDTNFYKEISQNLKDFPRYFSLGIFDISYKMGTENGMVNFKNLSFKNRVSRKLGLNYPKIFKEKSYRFDADLFNKKTPIYLKGYFQSYKYFIGVESKIRQWFEFPYENLGVGNEEIKSKILEKTSVSVHIRRGDYVENKKTKEFHGNCSLEYYKNAITYFLDIVKEFNIVFFSDDISWVRDEFKDLPNEKVFVTGNLHENSWKDMYLMSLCDHNIIANSSFSWWAAWLNNNSEKNVIAPKKWFADIDQEQKSLDLLPPSWIRM